MSDTPIPRCPHCGTPGNIDIETLESWAKNDISFRCNACGEASPAAEWLKSVKPKEELDA